MRKSKSKMTRLTAIVMAGAMVLGLSACGGKDAGSTTTAAGGAGTTAQAARDDCGAGISRRGSRREGDYGGGQYRMGHHDADEHNQQLYTYDL